LLVAAAAIGIEISVIWHSSQSHGRQFAMRGVTNNIRPMRKVLKVAMAPPDAFRIEAFHLDLAQSTVAQSGNQIA
jgi:hypothetical protein